MLPASAMERVTEHCQSPTPSPSVQAAVPCVGRWVRCPCHPTPIPRVKFIPLSEPKCSFHRFFKSVKTVILYLKIVKDFTSTWHPLPPQIAHTYSLYARATCMYMAKRQIPKPQCLDQTILHRQSILSCYHFAYLQIVCLFKVKIGLKIKKKICRYSTFLHLYFCRYSTFFTVFL